MVFCRRLLGSPLASRYRSSYLGAGHGVSYWRSVSGAEVDFVWQGPREDVPIEVKRTARPQPADARLCERAERPSSRVMAVPWNEAKA